jgi:thioesterase domain-containing protein
VLEGYNLLYGTSINTVPGPIDLTANPDFVNAGRTPPATGEPGDRLRPPAHNRQPVDPFGLEDNPVVGIVANVCGIIAGVAPETKRSRFRPRGSKELAAAGSALVTIQPGSRSNPPLFCVHAEAGDVSLYCGLARHLAPDQPVFGLCAPAASELGAHQRLERMAERHVREIRNAQPNGPYLIAGECTGGALAYEIAQQLRSADQEIALLALVDAFPSGLPRLTRFMPRSAYRILHRTRILGFHFSNLVRLGMDAKLAYAKSKARRARKALIAKASGVLRRSAATASPKLAFREALAAYNPRPYAGSAVLFRAARLPLGIQASPDLGWGGLVEDLEVETVPGYFATPMSEPGVRILADRFSRHLVSATVKGDARPSGLGAPSPR